MAQLKQEPRTIFDGVKPGGHGYEPRRPPRGGLPNKHEIRTTTLREYNAYWEKTGETIPHWRPKYPDGHHITHLYRRIGDDYGSDLYFPDMDEAMSHYLKENQNVDFAKEEVRQRALLQVSKASEGQPAKRPFLSWSYDLERVHFGSANKIFLGGNAKKIFVRLDLLALYSDKKLTETSFADISTIPAWANFFRTVLSWHKGQKIEKKGLIRQNAWLQVVD